MKNIFNFLSVLLLSSLILVSCDQDETTFNALDFPNQAFIKFQASSLSSLEASTDGIEVVAELSNSLKSHTTPITVTVNITAENAVAGTNYEVVDNKAAFVFEPGSFTDKIVINSIDNFDEDGDKKLTFELVSVTGANVSLGTPGPDSLGNSVVLNLQDDDCGYTFQDLADASWSGTDSSSGNEGPNASQIDISTDGTNLLATGIAYGWLTNTAYWNEVIVTETPTILSIDEVGAITIAEQPLCTTTWLGDPQPAYSIRGTGQFTSCSKTMVISYDLIQGGSVLRSFTETISY